MHQYSVEAVVLRYETVHGVLLRMVCSRSCVAAEVYKSPGMAFVNFFRYIVLLSYIIPISLRVSLDMAKTMYARDVEKDKVRSSPHPQEASRDDDKSRSVQL